MPDAPCAQCESAVENKTEGYKCAPCQMCYKMSQTNKIIG